MKRLRSTKLPGYLKARYLKIGLIVGALWGFLSMTTFVMVGMFGSEDHPYHWLYRSFQTSVYTLWFEIIFLPFLLSFKIFFTAVGALFVVLASIPIGALIGMAIGAVVSALSYLIRKG